MSAVSCDTCGYLKPTQRPLTRQQSPFSVLSALYQISWSPLIGASSAFWSLSGCSVDPGVLHKGVLQLHCQDMNQRILNLSILLGSSRPPEPRCRSHSGLAAVTLPQAVGTVVGSDQVCAAWRGRCPTQKPLPSACAMAVRFPSACLTFFPSQGGKGLHVSRPIATQSAWKHL